MAWAAIESLRGWVAPRKGLIKGLVGVAIEGVSHCIPGGTVVKRLLDELAAHGVDRLADPDTEVKDLKAAGQPFPTEQIDQISCWLETLSHSYAGLLDRLEPLAQAASQGQEPDWVALVRQAMQERGELAAEFQTCLREVRYHTYSLARIEERLDQQLHVQNNIALGLEDYKSYLVELPGFTDYLRLPQEQRTAVQEALGSFQAGRPEDATRALLALLQQQGVSEEVIRQHLGLMYVSQGKLGEAARQLDAVASMAGQAPGLVQTLTTVRTATSAGGSVPVWRSLPRGLIVDHRYRIEAEVGRGGMASVYRAVGVDRLNRGQVVAIKVPAPSIMADERTCQRFLAEIEITRQLSSAHHPGIVRTLDYVHLEEPHSGERLYGLVMELVEGRSLATYLAQRRLAGRPLDPTEIATILAAVGEALDHAHGQTPPVYHRDVKPHNVMVGSDGSIKLMDFGIARVLDESRDRATTAGHVVGTLAYMPPEMMDPGGEADARTDVYLLGNLLVELLTFSPTGNAEKRRDCPPAWLDLIADALNRFTSRRPPTARAFLTRLTQAATPLPRLPREPDQGVAPAAPAAEEKGTTCPTCGAACVPGAIACMDCGYLLVAPGETAEPAADGLNICSNPACACANPPGQRTCVRCGSPLPPQPGTVLLDRYRLEKLHGFSGPSTLYLARDLQADQPVRLKIGFAEDPAEYRLRVKLIQWEAEALRMLDGLAIPRLIEWREDSPNVYLVQEHIPGQRLDAVLDAQGDQPFPFERIVQWARTLCEILDRLHSQEPPWIALGLEPEDLVVTPDQKLIVADVSTARDQNRRRQERQERQSAKTRVYTSGYAPPEQVMGRPDPRSDLFRLAALLYRLATGQEPDGAYSGTLLREKLNSRDVTIPGDQRWLYELICINLGEDAGDRYTSARELREDLERRQATRCRAHLLPQKVDSIRCLEKACGAVNLLTARRCARCGASLPLPPDTMIDRRHRLVRLLAQGNMRNVYLARYQDRESYPCVVKELLAPDARRFASRIRFLERETQALKMLADSHLTPRHLSLVKDDESAYLIEEHIAGRSLLDILLENDGRPFRLEQVVGWGSRLCEILERLHAEDPPWVVRNLNPGNLVLDESQSLKLLDLWMARPLARESGANYTRVFVEGYSPPEQVMNRPDTRSDLFALAATLYHLATGTPPTEDSWQELDAQLRASPSPFPPRWRWLFQLLHANLAEDVEQRYPSASAFRADLEQREFSSGKAAAAPLVICPGCRHRQSGILRSCRQCRKSIPISDGLVLHGRLEVEQQLARGGFSILYLAKDQKTQKSLVIKDLLLDDPKQEALRQRFFQREIAALKTLRGQPLVPKLYGWCRAPQTARLFLEYLRGKDLRALLEASDRTPFPFDRVVDWGVQLCDVLTLLHQQDPPWVYRDLKPENLILLERGGTLKLVDFGSACQLGATMKERRAPRTRLGTEDYAAPEQLLGTPCPRSDLFALAATLYHLATGRPPEGTATGEELAAQLSSADCPYPPEQRWLFELLRINLAADRNERYLTAKSFQLDLKRRRLTSKVMCSKCGTANPPRTPYCKGCQTPLTPATPPCDVCGTSNHMGSTTCVRCAADLEY